jgi:hypothetical protein
MIQPLTNRGVLLSTLLQDISHITNQLLNVLLQIANKLGLKKNPKLVDWIIKKGTMPRLEGTLLLQPADRLS